MTRLHLKDDNYTIILRNRREANQKCTSIVRIDLKRNRNRTRRSFKFQS